MGMFAIPTGVTIVLLCEMDASYCCEGGRVPSCYYDMSKFMSPAPPNQYPYGQSPTGGAGSNWHKKGPAGR